MFKENIVDPKLFKSFTGSRSWAGINVSKLEVLGSFEASVVDDICKKIDFYIVPKNTFFWVEIS